MASFAMAMMGPYIVEPTLEVCVENFKSSNQNMPLLEIQEPTLAILTALITFTSHWWRPAP